MNDNQIMNELDRTKTICEQVEFLFGEASCQGRMLSLAETLRADELSRALLSQIRRLPRKLSLQDESHQLQQRAGETMDMLRLTLRKIAFPSVPSERPGSSARNMTSYSV